MRGIWVTGLEQSIFVENASHKLEFDQIPKDVVWLDIDVTVAFKKAGVPFDGRERQFLVSFSGRKSTRRGLYGHMGQYKSGVLVDKIFTIRPLD
jgi:hypothetical protein